MERFKYTSEIYFYAKTDLRNKNETQNKKMGLKELFGYSDIKHFEGIYSKQRFSKNGEYTQIVKGREVESIDRKVFDEKKTEIDNIADPARIKVVMTFQLNDKGIKKGKGTIKSFYVEINFKIDNNVIFLSKTGSSDTTKKEGETVLQLIQKLTKNDNLKLQSDEQTVDVVGFGSNDNVTGGKKTIKNRKMTKRVVKKPITLKKRLMKKGKGKNKKL